MVKNDQKKFKIKAYKKKFWIQTTEIFRIGNPRGKACLSFLERFLKNSRIHYIEAEELLYQACIRANDYIEKNCKPISNPAAWLRMTSLNIIKEEVRENIKRDQIIRDIYIEGNESNEKELNEINEKALDKALENLEIALTNIPYKEQKIIKMRFFEKLSYSDIQKYYKEKENLILKKDALRKRTSRSLKLLLKEYQNLQKEYIK